MCVEKIMNRFKTESDCLEYICKTRWGKKKRCPYCGSDQISRHIEKVGRDRFQCSGCRKSFSILVGTVFHQSQLPLRKLLLVIAIITESSVHMSVRKLSSLVGISEESSHHLIKRIRTEFNLPVQPFKLDMSFEAAVKIAFSTNKTKACRA